MKVGYVGLDARGVPLARRLMIGHQLHAHDEGQDALREIEKEGARAVESLPALASACEVIMICSQSSAHARAMLFGKDGLSAGLSPGKIVIHQTPADPNETRRIAADLLRSGVLLIDAAVQCESSGAGEGASAVFCGGPAQAVESVRSLLEAICPTVLHCGDAGIGHAMKLVTSAVAACNRLITYECAAMGVKNGLTVKDMSAVINISSGSSSASERILPELASGGRTADLQLDQVVQELRLASSMALTCGAPMLIANLARTIFEAGANQLGATASLDEMSRLYESMAGIRFDSVPVGLVEAPT